MYLYLQYTIEQRRGAVDIIISSNTSKPIYEQITSQIKAMIMSGELKTGDPIPSMRSLAKSIHVSVITVQKAYEDLQRDGFIETTVGRGVSSPPKTRIFTRRSSSGRPRNTCSRPPTSAEPAAFPWRSWWSCCGSSTRIRRFDVWTETRWWSMD